MLLQKLFNQHICVNDNHTGERAKNNLGFAVSSFTTSKRKIKKELSCFENIWKDSCIGRTMQPHFHCVQPGIHNSPSSWHKAMCTLPLFRVHKGCLTPTRKRQTKVGPAEPLQQVEKSQVFQHVVIQRY